MENQNTFEVNRLQDFLALRACSASRSPLWSPDISQQLWIEFEAGATHYDLRAVLIGVRITICILVIGVGLQLQHRLPTPHCPNSIDYYCYYRTLNPTCRHRIASLLLHIYMFNCSLHLLRHQLLDPLQAHHRNQCKRHKRHNAGPRRSVRMRISPLIRQHDPSLCPH